MVCLISLGSLQAQQIKATIFYRIEKASRGQLYQYSKRYLAAQDIVTEDATTYTLLYADRYVPTQAQPANKPQQPAKEQTTVAHQLPLQEDALLAASDARLAECVAKQIYRIRDARTNLICGEVEHMPADGASIRLMLKEMNKQEEELTAMFVGTVQASTAHGVINLTPYLMSDTRQVVARFSRFAGIVPADDLSGEPIYADVKVATEKVLAAVQPKRKKDQPLYEDRVISRTICLTYNNKNIYEETVTY